uniref:Uncharacterized protein n=1 Tax=Rhizophora mucronata TaxID=61149 RepID=A0A2P2NIV7_RHIMU
MMCPYFSISVTEPNPVLVSGSTFWW